MENLNSIISFYENRIKSTINCIDHLRNANKTRMTTYLVQQEIEMQEGELEVFQDTIKYLNQLQELKANSVIEIE